MDKKLNINRPGKRGGTRKGSGRPKNENKPILIQCHPDYIKTIRGFSKIINFIPQDKKDLLLSEMDAEILKHKLKIKKK